MFINKCEHRIGVGSKIRAARIHPRITEMEDVVIDKIIEFHFISSVDLWFLFVTDEKGDQFVTNQRILTI